VLGFSGRAGLVVSVSFGADALGAVLGSGAAASGHHRGPVVAVVSVPVGFGVRQVASWSAQAGEQQRTARSGDVGLPGPVNRE
jgi:hypothetical protein